MIRRLLNWMLPDSEDTEPPVNPIKPITDQPALDRAFRAPLAVLYKHSPICAVSSWTRREVQKFANEHPSAEVYQIDVVGNRDISLQIEERMGIRHQSPQALVIRHGKPAWSGSHGVITADALRQQVGPEAE